MKPRVLILKAAGVNCDAETAHAFEAAGARSVFVHVNELTRGSRKLDDFQILALSGGFTYGDDIAAGRILANELKCFLKDELTKFIEQGNLVIGICNGFQVLVKAGLLPGGDSGRQEATLAENDGGLFVDRWIHLAVADESRSLCVWTRGIRHVLALPIAHGEGKFIPRSEEILDRLRANNQIVFQYCDKVGVVGSRGANPNGSVDHIAGICDPTGRILGLMPHPERHLVSWQHPCWTREGLKRHGDGFAIFLNAVNYFRKG